MRDGEQQSTNRTINRRTTMTDTGWFKVARHIFSHPIADDLPWCKGFMWLYLVSMAAHDEYVVTICGQDCKLKRGQLSVSTYDLATKAGWSRGKVIRFLGYLHTEGMIQMHTNFSGTFIKVVNYDKWQTQAMVLPTGLQTVLPTVLAETASVQLVDGVPAPATVLPTVLPTGQANKEKSSHTLLKKEDTRMSLQEKEPPKVPKVKARTKPAMSEEAAEVLAYLNQTADTKFKNPGEIPARLAEGNTVEECKIIIDKKCGEWLTTEFAKNLNPVTLFRAIHFDTYLNQKGLRPIPRYNSGAMKGKPIVINHHDTQAQENKRPTAMIDMTKLIRGD